jgi:dephospho-CoA kinase
MMINKAIYLIIQFPLGLVSAAATERLCRSSHQLTKWRNIGAKSAVAYVLTYITVGSDTHIGNASLTEVLYTLARVFLLLTGVVIGTALQPVGLTGGIATGKSTVSSLLSSQGDETDFVIIDIDGIAHDILLPEKLGKNSVYHRLVHEFGTEILDTKDNAAVPLIDRRKLGDIVFKDRQKRKRLNSITHPKIIKTMLQRILSAGLNFKSKQRRVVCADIPLLFEGGLPMRMLFGTIVVVSCNPDVQLERLQKRNSDLTIDQCRERIASQMPVELKARKAHKVIRNDGEMKDLKSQVLQVKKEVTRAIIGKERGIELSWLVMGFASMKLLWNHSA